MALEKVGLQATIEGMSAFNSAASQIDRAYGQLGTSSERAAGRMSRMGDIARTAIGFAVGTVAVSAIKGLASGLGDLVTRAAPLRDMEVAFERLAGSYDINSGRMIEAMRSMAKGTIADSDLIAAANKALIGSGQELGKEFGEALPRLLEMARASAKATGEDVGFLFESLVLGIKRSSPMIIDNTGLQLKLGEAQEAYAKSLGITVAEMSAEQKQIALLTATLEAGAGMVEAMGDEQLTTAERMAQLRATTKNLKDEIGKALLPVLDALLKFLVPIAQKLTTALVPAMQRFIFYITNIGRAFAALKKGDIPFFWELIEDVMLRVLGKEMTNRIFKFIDLISGLVQAFGWLRAGNIDAFLEKLWFTLEGIFGPSMAGRITNFAEMVIGAIQKFSGAISGIAQAFAWLWAGDIGAFLEKLWFTLEETFGPDMADLITNFAERIVNAAQLIKAGFDRIKTVAVGLWQEYLYPHFAAISAGIASWWNEVGGAQGILGKIRAGWQQYIAEPLTGFYNRHLREHFESIKKGIGAWWTGLGEEEGALGKIRAGWQRYIAKPLMGFYDKHLKEHFENIKKSIGAWWAGLGEEQGALGKIRAGWQLYIATPLRGFWDAHLAEPFTTMEQEIKGWGKRVFEDIKAKLAENEIDWATWQVDISGWIETLRVDYIEKLRDTWAVTTKVMREKWEEFWAAFQPVIAPMQEYFNWWVDEELLPAIRKMTEELAATYNEHLKPAIDDITEAIRKFIDKLTEHFTPAVEGGTSALQKFIDEHPELAEFLKHAAELAATLAGATAFGFLKAVAEAITTSIKILTLGLELLGGAIDLAATAVIGITDNIIWWIDRIEWVIGKVSDLRDAISKRFQIGVGITWPSIPDWVTRGFHFSIGVGIRWPSPPSWLTWLMGQSPSPAVLDIAALNTQLRETSRILGAIGTPGIQIPMGGLVPATVSPIAGGTSYGPVTNISVNANYAEAQSPIRVQQDIEAMMIRYRMS